MSKSAEETRKMVKENYTKFIEKGSSCGCSGGSCCGGTADAKNISKSVGYSEKDINAVPDGANLDFGCGNPVAIASIKEGETVLDLGSGAGLDAFLASQKVGPKGKVIGVDMTPDMVAKARINAKSGNYTNVEFRLGEIEKLPVEDNSVDLIISNCVINLSPEKEKTFREAFRVLKPGGRMMISDLVLKKELPQNVKESAEAYAGCIAGAVLKNEYLDHVSSAGFRNIKVLKETPYAEMKEYIESISLSAIK